MPTAADLMSGQVTSDFVIDLVEHADAVFVRESAQFLGRNGMSRSRIVTVLVQELGIPLQAACRLADEANPAIN